MPYYSLQVVDENRSLSTPARDRSDALAVFGKELGLKLTLEDDGTAVATFLLDEWWNDGPHWVNPTIPVYKAPT